MGGAPSARSVAGSILLAVALCMVAVACARSTPPQLAATASDPHFKTYDEYLKGVKARVTKAWDLSGVLKVHASEREQFGVRDRLTILDVTLDSAGAISAMSVHRSSGLTFLDDEAMAAFRRAAPFETPPSALLRADGTVLFPAGFYVEAAAVR